jgi:membrane protein
LLTPPSGDPAPERPPDNRFTRLLLRIEHGVSQIGWALVRAYHWLDEATDGILPYLLKGWQDFGQRDTRYAASLAYYAIFSLFPLILLGVALVSGLLGPAIAQEQVSVLLNNFFPADTLSLIEENVLRALEQRQSFGIVALISLGWSGLSLFANLTVAIDNIFHPTRWRPLWHKRILALGMVIVLALLLLISLFTSLVFRLLNMLFMDQPGSPLDIIGLFVPLGLNMSIFALLFRHVPRVHVRWDAIWPAAALGGVGWELSQRLFAWYLDNFGNYSVIYGSLGTVIVLLLWIYLSMAILLLAAELCNALNGWYQARERPEPAEETDNPSLPAPTPPQNPTPRA